MKRSRIAAVVIMLVLTFAVVDTASAFGLLRALFGRRRDVVVVNNNGGGFGNQVIVDRFGRVRTFNNFNRFNRFGIRGNPVFVRDACGNLRQIR